MKKKKGKKLIILIIVIVLIVGGLWACSNMGGDAMNMVETIKPEIGTVEELVSTSGVVASEEVKTYFAPVTGKISEVLVEAGDVVKAGDLLISYDMDEMAETLEQARLQYISGNSSYNGSLADSKDAQAKLTEADTNISVLEQQIKDEKAMIKDLKERLTTIQTESSNSLAEESMNLQKKLIELQKDPVANEEEIRQVQIAMQTNQYVSQIVGTSGEQAELQEKIAEEEERLAGYQEYKAEMEAQKQQAEAVTLSSYQRENLSATEQLNLIAYENAQEDYDIANQGIVAAFDGVVTELSAIESMTVGESVQLLTLANYNQVCVKLSVTKYDLARITVGQTADITISGSTYEGTIVKIDRMATQNVSGNAQVGVEIHIENPDNNIYLGLDAKVQIHAGKAEDALLIPVNALNADKNGDFVYVEENGVVVRKDIVTGISSTEYIEVKEGLTSEDNVIVSSYVTLEEGMAVYNMTAMVTE